MWNRRKEKKEEQGSVWSRIKIKETPRNARNEKNAETNFLDTECMCNGKELMENRKNKKDNSPPPSDIIFFSFSPSFVLASFPFLLPPPLFHREFPLLTGERETKSAGRVQVTQSLLFRACNFEGCARVSCRLKGLRGRYLGAETIYRGSV